MVLLKDHHRVELPHAVLPFCPQGFLALSASEGLPLNVFLLAAVVVREL